MKSASTPEVFKAEIRIEGTKIEYKHKKEALKRAHYASYQDPIYHASDPYLFHQACESSDDHVKDAALHLISSIQQRQGGDMKPHPLIN